MKCVYVYIDEFYSDRASVHTKCRCETTCCTSILCSATKGCLPWGEKHVASCRRLERDMQKKTWQGRLISLGHVRTHTIGGYCDMAVSRSLFLYPSLPGSDSNLSKSIQVRAGMGSPRIIEIIGGKIGQLGAIWCVRGGDRDEVFLLAVPGAHPLCTSGAVKFHVVAYLIKSQPDLFLFHVEKIQAEVRGHVGVVRLRGHIGGI